MKVLIGGYLAKPLVIPLTSMISATAPVEFEAIGEWIAESQEIASDIAITPEPIFFFSRRRLGIRSQRPQVVGEGGASFADRKTPPPLSLRRMIFTHCKALAYDIAYYCDAKLRRKHYQPIVSKFDLIHVHSVFETIAASRFGILGADQPLVVTLWGSDVLRSTNPFVVARQRRLLDQATLITHSTPEFREVILAKYGRHLAPKLRETYFSINDDMVQRITALGKSAARNAFAKKHDVPEQSLVVCVGHNASPANRQLEVLRSIGAIRSSLERPLFIVVPMTYCQTDKRHIECVRQELREQKLAGVVLTDFLGDDELAELRKATDVFVYAAISDVFSATISQGLIAKQVVITGNWLPNRARKRAGCVFWEIDDVADAGTQLAELCGPAWEEVQKSVQINEDVGRTFFDSQRLGTAWYDVYREAMRIKERT